MKLRIRADGDGDGHLMTGAGARLYLNDQDVSHYVSCVVLTVDASEAIRAEVTLFLSSVDVDVPAAVAALLSAAPTSSVLGSKTTRASERVRK